jgi:hypothetical protein
MAPRSDIRASAGKKATGGKLEEAPVTAFSQLRGKVGTRCEKSKSGFNTEPSAAAGIFAATLTREQEISLIRGKSERCTVGRLIQT